MNRVLGVVGHLWANRATRGAAVAVVVVLLVCELGPIWAPPWKEQFQQSERVVFKLIMALALWGQFSKEDPPGAPAAGTISQGGQQQPK